MKRVWIGITVVWGIVGSLFNVLEAYQIINTGLSPYLLNAIVLGIFMALILVIVTYKDPTKATVIEATNSGIRLHPLGKLTMSDRNVIISLSGRMQEAHGYSDLSGIEKEYKAGFDTEDIMKRPCTDCGKPRNKWGKH